MTVIEKIYRADLPRFHKIIRLSVIVLLNFEQSYGKLTPYGKLALDYLRKLIHDEVVISALFFLTGFLSSPQKLKKLKKLCPEYDEKEARKYNLKHRKYKYRR